MKKFLEWPSIEQFRHVVRTVRTRATFVGKDEAGEAIYDNTKSAPNIKFTGTVKSHGTSAAIGYDCEGGEVWAQSRSQIITPENDNFGFARFVKDREEWIKNELLASIIQFFNQKAETPSLKQIVVYGEWCGPGVQKKVAVAHLPTRIFAIFGIRVVFDTNDGDWYWTMPQVMLKECLNFVRQCIDINELNIYSIYQFGEYNIEIDFENPEAAQNELVRLTEEVEANCPIGKYFGVTENTIGEGIVWCADEDPSLIYKVKGERHSPTKVDKLASVDPEKVKSIKEFVERTVTENRLQQGLEILRRDNLIVDIRATGIFVKWVSDDIAKEESDVLEASGLTMKDVGSVISKKAGTWFRTYGIEA